MSQDEDNKQKNDNASNLQQPVTEGNLNATDLQKEKSSTKSAQSSQSNSLSDKLEARITELESKVQDTETKLKSALADYQNMLREVDTQREFTSSLIKRAVFKDLIDLFTDLYFGLEQLPKELRENSYVVGLEGIIAKYRDLLKKHEITEIRFNDGDAYDPGKAEAVGIIPDAEKDGKVASTVQPGYSINDVLIKPARVMIFKKS